MIHSILQASVSSNYSDVSQVSQSGSHCWRAAYCWHDSETKPEVVFWSYRRLEGSHWDYFIPASSWPWFCFCFCFCFSMINFLSLFRLMPVLWYYLFHHLCRLPCVSQFYFVGLNSLDWSDHMNQEISPRYLPPPQFSLSVILIPLFLAFHYFASHSHPIDFSWPVRRNGSCWTQRSHQFLC